jgi:hypothetical protein
MLPDKLTLENLVPSVTDTTSLQTLSKPQRLALYNLCTIMMLTFYDKDMRESAEKLRDLIRKNTLDVKHNKCVFDDTERDRRLEQNPIILSSEKDADT